MNKVLCLFAFKSDKNSSSDYLKQAKTLIKRAQQHEINIMLMTNVPSFFSGLDIEIIEPTVPDSYCNKVRLCEIALEKYETAIYLDVDCNIDFNLFKDVNFSKGFHYSEPWSTPAGIFAKSEDLIDTKEGSKYFTPLKNYCADKNLKIYDAPVICERIFAFTGKNTEFFDVFNSIAPIAEENDKEWGNYPIGGGEGLLMGIAIINSNIINNGISEEMQKINKQLYKV